MDKQMIEEMAMKIIMAGDMCRRIKDCDNCKYNYIDDSTLCEMHLMAEELLKYYQPKIPEGAFVLTKEEYETLRYLADECIRWREKNCNTNEICKEIKDNVFLKKGGDENAERYDCEL